MDYKKYQNARNAAWKILIDNDISELPIPIIKICNNLHITVKYNERLTGNISSGQSTIIKDKAYIMIAPDCNPQRKRFTVAHELGHIILGHVGKYRLINREPDPSDNPMEQAAQCICKQIACPCVYPMGLQNIVCRRNRKDLQYITNSGKISLYAISDFA